MTTSSLDTFELPGTEQLGFDPQELRERYAAEAQRRVRTDGESQFVEITNEGSHSHYLHDDPWADLAPREPITREVDVLVIGGGWAGLLSAARTLQAGFDDVLILEGGADFGGTWYWNRYPGAQCDIESYIYLPLLEETGYIPKEKYSYAPEIYEHAQRIARHFGLYERVCFQTLVLEMRWNDELSRWVVKTNRGDTIRARFVVSGTGPANRPRLPGIPGIEDYEGHSFHTSRWDYDFTGGAADDTNLHKLNDKRVAIIGTGATAVQCVPALAASARQLYVIQRTPSSVDVRDNHPTDPEWAASLEPGWQRELQRNFNAAFRGIEPFRPDLANDGWTRLRRNMEALADGTSLAELDAETLEGVRQIADFQTMNAIRSRVDDSVEDPATAARLKAWYNQMCKRPTFNDEYLPAFNRPNVEIIDVSDARGVDRITKTGFVANGVEYEVDCIIYASGFEITSDFHRRIGFEIYDEAGVSVYDIWTEKGMQTLHGLSSPGYPNWFMIGGLFGFSLGVNYAAVVDDLAQHVAYIMSEVRERGRNRVQPTTEAVDAWMEEMRAASFVRPGQIGCTPGYYNNEGMPGLQRRVNEQPYAPGANAFADLLAAWRASGDLAGLEVT